MRGVTGATAAAEPLPHHLRAHAASQLGASISYRLIAAVGKGANATERTCPASARCWFAAECGGGGGNLLCWPPQVSAAAVAEGEDAIRAATAAVSARVKVVRDLTTIDGKLCALAVKSALSSWAQDLKLDSF